MWILRQQDARMSREGNTMASRHRVVSTMPKNISRSLEVISLLYIKLKTIKIENKTYNNVASIARKACYIQGLRYTLFCFHWEIKCNGSRSNNRFSKIHAWPVAFLDRASWNFHWTHFFFQKYELEIICVNATRMLPPPLRGLQT